MFKVEKFTRLVGHFGYPKHNLVGRGRCGWKLFDEIKVVICD
jgi:hypothetical protein